MRCKDPARSIIQVRPGVLIAQTKMLSPCRAQGERSQCITYWQPGLVRCLKHAGGTRCRAHQFSRGVGLGWCLAFGEILASIFFLHL